MKLMKISPIFAAALSLLTLNLSAQAQEFVTGETKPTVVQFNGYGPLTVTSGDYNSVARTAQRGDLSDDQYDIGLIAAERKTTNEISSGAQPRAFFRCRTWSHYLIYLNSKAILVGEFNFGSLEKCEETQRLARNITSSCPLILTLDRRSHDVLKVEFPCDPNI